MFTAMLHDHHTDMISAVSRGLALAGKKRPAPSEEEDGGAAESSLTQPHRRSFKRQKKLA